MVNWAWTWARMLHQVYTNTSGLELPIAKTTAVMLLVEVCMSCSGPTPVLAPALALAPAAPA
jgi:hypothetical protein